MTNDSNTIKYIKTHKYLSNMRYTLSENLNFVGNYALRTTAHFEDQLTVMPFYGSKFSFARAT